MAPAGRRSPGANDSMAACGPFVMEPGQAAESSGLMREPVQFPSFAAAASPVGCRCAQSCNFRPSRCSGL